jgi:hypothetical protein
MASANVLIIEAQALLEMADAAMEYDVYHEVRGGGG